MSGRTDTNDAMASADSLPPEMSPSPHSSAASFPRAPPPPRSHSGYVGERPFTATDLMFLARMEEDIEGRRRSAFITELRKDPRFRPSMLEPPKPKFKEVTLTGGPIIKSHKHWKTGLEPKRPYQWGPLGGYY